MLENKPFKILVGLDLSEMDPYLIEYMHTIDQLFRIEKVIFLHNIKLGDLSRDLLSSHALAEIQQKVGGRMQKMVKKAGLSFSFEIVVKTEQLSEIAFEQVYKNNNYDLLIVGKKQELEGNGALSHKLVRLFPGATLFVPETYRAPVKTVVEAITFSRYTKSILGWGTWFRQNQKDQDIKHWAVHISKPFYTPLMTGKEAEKTIQLDIKRKKEKWEELSVSTEELEVISAGEKSVSSTLLKYIEDKKTDVLIIGVKSNSKIRELFMGSVANELLLRSTNTCLLFVKPIR